MGITSYFILICTLVILSVHNGAGQCEMENVNWQVPQQFDVLDTFRGELFARTTTGITGISRPIEMTTSLNGGPYLSVAHTDSRFSLTTTDAFADYEENETEVELSFSVIFGCEGTSEARLVFILGIKDTNNNDPIFRHDVYEFTVLAPLPPGWRITDCWNDIIARDIDLTTQRVEFNVYNTSSFEISYDAELSTTRKEFHAMLKTTNLIRSMPEPIEFGISATDVDLTNDPSRTTYATVRIKSNSEFELPEEIVFSQTYYMATYTVDQQVSIKESIALTHGYHEDVAFSLTDYSEYFSLVRNANDISIRVDVILPSALLDERHLIFVIEAKRNLTSGASATIILQLPNSVVLRFAQTRYVGSVIGGSLQLSSLTLTTGYDLPLQLNVTGEYASYFALTQESNEVIIRIETALPSEINENNAFILLDIEASYPEAVSGFTSVFLELDRKCSVSKSAPAFDQAYYKGEYSSEAGLLFEQNIQLLEQRNDSVLFNLTGEQSEWFDLSISEEDYVRVVLRESNPIPPAVVANNQQLVFLVTAQSPESATARATVIIVLRDEKTNKLRFDRVTYVGTIVENSVNLDPITLSGGYTSNVTFTLHGDLKCYFRANAVDATVKLELLTSIAQEDIPSNGIILLNIEASDTQSLPAFATIVLEYRDEVSATPTPTLSEPLFAETFYTGRYSQQNGLVFDTLITLVKGYDSSIVFGFESEQSQWFSLIQYENSVRLILREDIPPAIVDNNHQLIFVVTAQRPGSSVARTVIIIVLNNDNTPPQIEFDSASYVIRVEIGQTGLVGSVRATTGNAETVTYSLFVDSEHLRARIAINNAGELRLSAPVNSGIYSFQAIATADSSQATASAKVHLSVEALTQCGDETVIAPLIVLERNEEEPLRDLVLLNTTEHVGCQYTLSNRWPADQKWLYVDETGLHATAIDREDPSIAFMTQSQVQVELTLVCDSDVRRSKRSTSEIIDWLGPYDYGTNTWLLGETILFNSRRSIVNLIVKDINDNAPVFVRKENEPIIVGYPVPDLQKSVLPRSLIELQATDEDIGENAALVYWSSEPQLAVSEGTGFVHVRNDLLLQQDQILTVNATDLNGRGHTGSINLMVKLLQSNHIAVITVQGAFLEDENRILSNVSTAIGYEVRALGSAVISGEGTEETLKMTRDVRTTGARLEVYIYGIDRNEPVDVNTLKTDISSAAVITDNITSILSLEDHLEGLLIRDNTGRDTGLLAATIVLGALLFILIVAVIVWFVLTRIKTRNYEQFSDANSIASRNESVSSTPKSVDTVDVTKTRLNIEELKRSERKLEDILSPSIKNMTDEQSASTKTNTENKILSAGPFAPIVIQDKLKDDGDDTDDDDEFGESKMPRRKSIVTFKEDVEKIIIDETHILGNIREVYKL